MRVLLLEESADGLLDLAIRAGALGHDVRYWVGSYDQYRHPTGRGLVERIPDWRGSVSWADLIVAGSNGKFLREMDAVRQRGTPMIGGHYEISQWEHDRQIGMAAFKRKKIPIADFTICKTFDEAMAVAATREEGVACKPCGSVGYGDKSLSFVGKSPEEVLWRLSRWKKEKKRFGDGLMLQERVSGVEYAVGGWVGPSGFVDGWEENFETKRMMAGDVGPNTGEMGTVMRLVKSSKLADKVLKPFEDELVNAGYCGNIDVNCITSEDGTPYPLEWTCRLGWPSTNIELALHKSDPIEFLACVASGERPPARRWDTVAVGVVLAIPPYPFGHERAEEVVDVPMWGITPGVEDNLHFCDVMLNRDNDLATAGSYVLVATGTADNVVAARNTAHRVLNRLTIPASPFWRNDIGARLRGQLPELQKHGFAKGMVYSS